jgi:ABC-type cobalamin transport system permease subunit
LVVFVVASFLLLSMGGVIVAAPVTVPLMYVASRRHPTPAFHAAGVVLGALTVAEVVWALTYIQVYEAQPWIWLLPVVGGLTTGLVFGWVRPRRHGRADPA